MVFCLLSLINKVVVTGDVPVPMGKGQLGKKSEKISGQLWAGGKSPGKAAVIVNGPSILGSSEVGQIVRLRLLTI